ncbi:MAG: biopolymer transporter ExbD [Deltaproteobacteria bacterium]|nr:biopolymer transporter ExbD [Deltaproteobacteria bacterium]MBZ0219215.1 biopolymer transporter ExbD [Deltaproteobacteria bacterium]
MGWKLRQGNERTISEINITPLADVMLVLLVIFMVTTPLIMTDSFKVKLPRAISSEAEPGKGAVVAVSEIGEITLNGRAVGMDGLQDALKAAFGHDSERTVIVRADRGVRHGVVVNVLDNARQAGAERLSIATEQDRR